MSKYAKSAQNQKFFIQQVQHIFRLIFVIDATSKPRWPPQTSFISWQSFIFSLLSNLGIKITAKRRLRNKKESSRLAAENIQRHQFVLRHLFWLVADQELQGVFFPFYQSFFYLMPFRLLVYKHWWVWLTSYFPLDICNHVYRGKFCTPSVFGFLRAAPFHYSM